MASATNTQTSDTCISCTATAGYVSSGATTGLSSTNNGAQGVCICTSLGQCCSLCRSAGFGRSSNAAVCVACPAGKWQPSQADVICTSCALGTYMLDVAIAQINISACRSCGLGYTTTLTASSGPDAQHGCLCDVGYELAMLLAELARLLAELARLLAGLARLLAMIYHNNP